MKLLKNEELTDVTLVCGDGQEIKAHKAILGSASPVLKKIFSKCGNERMCLYFSGLNLSNVEEIINFIYLGEATVSQTGIDSFFRICKEFQIEGLSDYSILPANKKCSSTTTKQMVDSEGGNQPLEISEFTLNSSETSQTMYPCEMCEFETDCEETIANIEQVST